MQNRLIYFLTALFVIDFGVNNYKVYGYQKHYNFIKYSFEWLPIRLFYLILC